MHWGGDVSIILPFRPSFYLASDESQDMSKAADLGVVGESHRPFSDNGLGPWLPHAMNSAQTLPIQYYPESSPFNFPTQHQFSFPPQVLQAFGQAQQQPFAHVGLQPTGGQAPGSFGVLPQP
ncbi:hypothetical protein N7494_005419 [Penicillium frequentans]|uniref:Uncharacterized protein n=1 Tax=Penicillium frequentans TaxID=3151616 RepID=A0AAD6GG38_9EURO|nr:hypothetical protein N7494_005419 [Penicillium glabrum]